MASATREVRGMTPNNAARISFITRQLLDVWSPSNVPWLNPVVAKRTLEESGANLARGATISRRIFGAGSPCSLSQI